MIPTQIRIAQNIVLNYLFVYFVYNFLTPLLTFLIYNACAYPFLFYRGTKCINLSPHGKLT